jgi:DNA-binding HxlR family transcriptional regulator
MSKRVDPHCRAFQNAVDLLARPWTGLILSVLQNGPLRFSELEERTRGVGAKTLSARLKDLEARRLVAPSRASRPRSSGGAGSWSRTISGRALSERQRGSTSTG